MAITVSFPIDTFTDAEGNPLSDGYLVLNISNDVLTPDSTQLCYRLAVTVPLDSEGVISGSPMFWPNPALYPIGSYYVLRAYSAVGELVLGPLVVTVTGGSGGSGFGAAFGVAFGS